MDAINEDGESFLAQVAKGRNTTSDDLENILPISKNLSYYSAVQWSRFGGGFVCRRIVPRLITPDCFYH